MASSVPGWRRLCQCAHGIIPIPAPATVEILLCIPLNSGIVPYETTTPTGVAILVANVEIFTDIIDFQIEKIGYGIGYRDLEIPNVLRVYIGNKEINENISKEGAAREDQYIYETNITRYESGNF